VLERFDGCRSETRATRGLGYQVSVETEIAEQFGREWCAAWNAHDLEAILSHYAEDVVYRSPYIIELTGDVSGMIVGKAGVRAYFARGLEAIPDLEFDPVSVCVGVDSLVLNYISVSRGLRASEMFVLDGDGRAVEVRCHHTSV